MLVLSGLCLSTSPVFLLCFPNTSSTFFYVSSHCTPESVSCGDPSSVLRTPLPFAPRTGVFSSSALWLLVSLVIPRALPAQGREVPYPWHFLRRDPGQSSMCLWAVFQPPHPRRCPQGKCSCRGGQAPVHGMIPHNCPCPCFITVAAATLPSAHCWDSSPGGFPPLQRLLLPRTLCGFFSHRLSVLVWSGQLRPPLAHPPSPAPS